MFRFFSILSFVLFFTACNSDEAPADSLLASPPYNVLTDSIRQHPGNADLYFQRGYLLFRNSQSAHAERDLRQAWSIAPKPMYAVNLGILLRERNKDTAILFLEEAVKKLPQSVDVKLELARSYRDKGEAEKALQVTQQILAQAPNAIDAYDLQSEIQKSKGRDNEALAALEQAHRLRPDDAAVVEKLAFEYAASGNPRALPLIDSILRAGGAPGNAAPLYFKGLYYETTGKPAEAIRYFDQAIVADHNFIDAYMDKGQVLLETGRAEAARKVFETASHIDPKYPEAYLWLGKSLEALKDRKAAYDHYLNALNLDPQLTEAKEGMARTKG